jgi:transposase-like protein
MSATWYFSSTARHHSKTPVIDTVSIPNEKHGHRNGVGRVFREVKYRTTSFSNCFSNATAATADEWLKSFVFAWNRLI